MKTFLPPPCPLLRLLLGSMVLACGSTTIRAQTLPTDPLTLLKNRPTPATEPADNSDPIERQRHLLMDPHDDDPAVRAAALAKTRRLAQTLTSAQVRDAIHLAADQLLSQVRPPPGHALTFTVDQRPWFSFAGDQAVGAYALAAQALLEAGRYTGDPRLRPFSPELTPLLESLITATTQQTYSASLQACALSLLPQRPEVVKTLERIRNDLARGMEPEGGYGYTLRRSDYWDNSNTQYALLGMWAIADANIETPAKFWTTQDAHWRGCQAPAGGWAYRTPSAGFAPDGRLMAGLPSATFTAAGVASMFVTLDHLNGGGRNRDQDHALQAGLTAFQKDFTTNLPALGTDLYYAYGVQRVGVASGLKDIDHQNWFRLGAAALLSARAADNTWSYGYSRLLGSAYAILFLTHGGSPVIFNKLQYPGPWEDNPRDDANLTRRMSHLLELPLNWQIVSMDTNPVEWLDAPVLLITGHGAPHFTDQDLARLTTYLHAGGIVFSIATDNDTAFTTAMQKYAVQVTGGTYPLRPLPPGHPLFTLYRKIKTPPTLMGISNGSRELWIHSAADISGAWQRLDDANTTAWDIPMNLYLYATGRNRPRDRLDSLAVQLPAIPPHKTIALARLAYPGNCDPEPGAWPRFAKLLQRDANVHLDLHTVDIPALSPAGTPLAHLTGTDHFTLPDTSITALKTYLDHGGTLLADVTGGGDAFSESFLQLAHCLAPDAQIDILPPTSPLYNGSLPDTLPIDPAHLNFRKATPAGRRAGNGPGIWAWKINGRYAIFFSPLDITSGLLGTDTWGIAGYTPAASQQLARNLVLYANTLSAHPAATTQPTTAP